MNEMPQTRQTLPELRELYRLAGAAIMRKLDGDARMQRKWIDGRPTAEVVGAFIKPNDRLTSCERIEIYNRQYWFRLLDCLHDDYPGLRAALGQRKFNALIEAYLDKYPSRSYTLRNLGSRLEQFISETPQLTAPRTALASEIARFEWAQVVAFDGEARPALTVDELLGVDPAALRLGVQPYITLLDLHWPLDDWAIALKKSARSLRSEASNAVESERKVRRKRVPLPRRRRVFVAVHRYDNALYYKRLAPSAFRMLAALRDGRTLAHACSTVPPRLAGRVRHWFASWTKMGWFCRR
jgi:hypothetical protein